MDNVLQKLPNIDLAKNKIFEIILSLPEEDQNTIIKSLRQDLINYRYNNLKAAEKNLKYNQKNYIMIYFHNRYSSFEGIAYEAIDAIDRPFSKYNPAIIRMNNQYKLTYKIYWYNWSKNRIRLNWLNKIKDI